MISLGQYFLLCPLNKSERLALDQDANYLINDTVVNI